MIESPAWIQEVRRLMTEGKSYQAIFGELGVAVPKLRVLRFRDKEVIEEMMMEAEVLGFRLSRQGQTTTRTCLCCKSSFPSKGRHDRLCDPCRTRRIP